MEARIVGHLRVEAETDVRSLDHGNRFAAESGNNLGLRSSVLDAWCPDEHRAKRRNAQKRDRDISFERLHLPPVAVAADAHVENSERDLIRPAVEHLAA